jgi:hypothetical protein
MRKITTGKYVIAIFADAAYSPTDSAHKYDFTYFEDRDYECSTIVGIEVFEAEILIKSAVIEAFGVSTAIHETSFVFDPDRIVICCSDTLFCLSIPALSLLWKTKADTSTCFQIFKYKSDYIVHGELEISRIGNDGQMIWQQRGGEIFTRQYPEKDDFMITETHISATDWENRKYRFDFDGNVF